MLANFPPVFYFRDSFVMMQPCESLPVLKEAHDLLRDGQISFATQTAAPHPVQALQVQVWFRQVYLIF